jgi:surface antigen
MQARGAGAKSLIFGSFLFLTCQFAGQPADASTTTTQQRTSTDPSQQTTQASARRTAHAAAQGRFAAHGRQYARAGGISCVPFARADSGISVAGNAWEWWDNAAGVYARGSLPEAGSVLTFRSNGRMRLGHVAVVSRVINPREIEIEHANWWGPGMRGGVARNIPVVDVSEANDWTAVRVGLGRSGEFGAVYPTYGFIYDRADSGVMVASNSAPAPQPELNPVPRDLRPATERGWQTYEEVAEAPDVPAAAKRHRRVIHLASGRVHLASAVADQRQ